MRVGESLPPLRKRVSTLQCVLLEDKHKESLLCVLSSCLPSQLLCVEALFSPSLLEALCIQVNLLSTFVMMWRKEVEQSCSASFLADPLEEIQANLSLWIEVNQKSCPFISCSSWCSCMVTRRIWKSKPSPGRKPSCQEPWSSAGLKSANPAIRVEVFPVVKDATFNSATVSPAYRLCTNKPLQILDTK